MSENGNRNGSKGKALATFEQAFALRENALKDPNFQALYQEVLRRLRADIERRSNFGTVELLMTERVAFMYCWTRDRESRGIGIDGVNPEDPKTAPGFAQERNYRETNDMLWRWMTDLQKAEAKVMPDPASVKDQAYEEMGSLIADACDELPPEIGEPARAKITEKFEERERARAD
jgi:hypothetical protein